MRRLFAIVMVTVGVGFLAPVIGATPASAWSEQNCEQLCRMTADGDLVRYCIRDKIKCSRFRGGVHESMAVVRAKAANYNSRNAARRAYERQFRRLGQPYGRPRTFY